MFAREDIHMKTIVNDRRNAPRKTPPEPIEVAFYRNGGLYFGSVADLSPGGACFKVPLEKSAKKPMISPGNMMEYCITSSDGTSKCKGNVRWTRRNGDRLLYGIAFLQNEEEDDDPLGMTINRYFRSDNGGNRRYHDVPRIRG